ncbi:MAG: afr 5 [Paenibacillaceae bacterium]|jgi:predicted dehydrogenase|nr:afr 5 [Paenibacillaceae bacterium]
MMSVKIGMIGAGGIARSHHLPNLLKLGNVELVAVANRTAQSGYEAAKRFGFRKVYETWHDVVDDPEVDAVFICTPPYLHAKASLYALQKKKHVFCQARMAMDLQQAKQMLDADEKLSLTTMLCPAPHYMTVRPYVLQLIRDGLIGEVRHIAVSHPASTFLNANQPLHWRQRRDLQGINALDVGIMGEVLIRWFGPLAHVQSMGTTWVRCRLPDAEGRTEAELPDSVMVIGRFESGSQLTALFSGAVKGGRSQMAIHGSEGTITCFPTGSIVIVNTGEGDERVEVPEDMQGRWTVEQDFIDAIRHGRKGSPSFRDGVQYMAFTHSVITEIN